MQEEKIENVQLDDSINKSKACRKKDNIRNYYTHNNGYYYKLL